ncbi:Cthe_2314 family HEPN domain-containing protein [Paenibacillus silvisoli]|uniref:Cthe_2314 family HEPN domain-containing protein n=1 Tax=Paenibacillus silvisoli TaxID=3110539 RepID=UPI0028038F42|nr:Cthe_2314 family HEPN domain-containing protein [Paenibacillus silvisoli]
MLRMLFGEPPRVLDGKLLETMQAMERYAAALHKQIEKSHDVDHKLRKYEIYTQGLIVSLDELEESQYAARKFSRLITSTSYSSMSQEERMNYHRYVYFDKNAFIRQFSLLDKLGTLMNDYLGLQTERVKPHFSYFTVLRTMMQRKAHQELALPLFELKEQAKPAMNRLRKRRNMEIHFMNSEMQDDLRQSHEDYDEEHQLENIAQQMSDLDEMMDLVLDTLRLTFHHAYRQMRK